MQTLKGFLRILLGIFFVIAGANHFLMPEFYLRMMPPYLPMHLALNYLSGAAEIVAGVLVFTARYRNLAKFGLIALLVAVFPANLHMATNPELFPEISQTALWARLPFQLLFIAWVWWCLSEEKKIA